MKFSLMINSKTVALEMSIHLCKNNWFLAAHVLGVTVLGVTARLPVPNETESRTNKPARLAIIARQLNKFINRFKSTPAINAAKTG
jgi:hypothetical protein